MDMDCHVNGGELDCETTVQVLFCDITPHRYLGFLLAFDSPGFNILYKRWGKTCSWHWG